jgi:hypothetical protein
MTTFLKTDLGRPNLVRENPRLSKSLRELNDSITSFEKIHARHREKAKHPGVLDENALEGVLQQNILGEDVFHIAALLENRVNSTLDLQAESNADPTKRPSSFLYVAKLIPLVKLVTDIGGLAAQVTFPFLIN